MIFLLNLIGLLVLSGCGDFEKSVIPGVKMDYGLVIESDGDNLEYEWVISLTQAVDRPVTLEYSTLEVTADSGQDFTAVESGSVTFEAGALTASVMFEIVSDSHLELAGKP